MKIIETPFEKTFNLEPGSTLLTNNVDIYEENEEENDKEIVNKETDMNNVYDEKDNEIESQLETIYKKAINAFDDYTELIDLIEGKYKARNSEVAVLYLNAALSAINAKKDFKMNKDKLNKKNESSGPRVINNNLITNTNDLIKLLSEKNKTKDITPK